MATRIHPTAVISPGAELGEDVEVGPYTLIGPRVRIGDRTKVGAQVVIDGVTHVGEDNLIVGQASLRRKVGQHALVEIAPEARHAPLDLGAAPDGGQIEERDAHRAAS